MANTASAAKRARQSATQAAGNKRVRTSIKKELKTVREAIAGGNKQTAQTAFRKLSSVLDRAVKTARLHRNSANRHKSDLSRRIVALA